MPARYIIVAALRQPLNDVWHRMTRVRTASLAVLLVCCAKNGLLIKVQARDAGPFEDSVMSELEMQAKRGSLRVTDERHREQFGDEVSSAYLVKVSDAPGDMLLIEIVWQAPNDAHAAISVVMRNEIRGAEPAHRQQMEGIAKRFHALLAARFGASSVVISTEKTAPSWTR